MSMFYFVIASESERAILGVKFVAKLYLQNAQFL